MRDFKEKCLENNNYSSSPILAVRSARLSLHQFLVTGLFCATFKNFINV